MSTETVCDTCHEWNRWMRKEVGRCTDCHDDVCEECNVGTEDRVKLYAHLCPKCAEHRREHAAFVKDGRVTKPGDEWPCCGAPATTAEIAGNTTQEGA